MDAAALYLDLLKKCLVNGIYGSDQEAVDWSAVVGPERAAELSATGLRCVRRKAFDPAVRGDGRDWPAEAHTMIGMKRLDQLQDAVETILREGVPGDLIETGVWRGGATILMRAVLKAHGVTDRNVWVADSFAGLPPPDTEKYPHDAGDPHHSFAALAVPLDEVRANFARYGLLDDQVRFLPGWFKDTLPAAPTGPLAVIRLDGDMYGSTMEALEALYPRLSSGGFLIVDDYGAIAACRAAVNSYRTRHDIADELVAIDWTGVVWRTRQASYFAVQRDTCSGQRSRKPPDLQ